MGPQRQAYWINHRGYLLLVAPQHLRMATSEERLAHETVAQLLQGGNAVRRVAVGLDLVFPAPAATMRPAPRGYAPVAPPAFALLPSGLVELAVLIPLEI